MPFGMGSTGSFNAATDIPDLSGQVAIVTGGNTGIGYETTLALAAKSARVFLLARSESRAQSAIQQIKALHPNAQVEWIEFDLCSVQSCRRAAEEIIKKVNYVDMIANNAGIMATPYRTTDGIENQFYNHLGHFALVKFLGPLIRATAEAGRPVRIATTSSVGHSLYGQSDMWYKDLDSINDQKYTLWGRYGQSKLANVLFSTHFATHASAILNLSPAAAKNIYSNSLHPGNVNTELLRGPAEDSFFIRLIRQSGLPRLLLLSPENGAATQLWLVTNPRVIEEKITGKYFTPIAQPAAPSNLAQEAERGEALWELSEKLVEERKDGWSA